jgi:hypothetical protein
MVTDFKLKVPKMKEGQEPTPILSFTLTMEADPKDPSGTPVFVGRLKMEGGFD